MNLNLNFHHAMKTNFANTGYRVPDAGYLRLRSRQRKEAQTTISHALVVLWSLAIAGWSLPQARAVIPEPDNVVYGQIAIGTNLVTAQRTNVVIEVRYSNDTNLISANVLASYRMGQNPNLGDRYAVAIPFWSEEDTINPLPSPAGSNMIIVVKETLVIARQTYTYLRYQTNFALVDRGYVERMDFGAVPTNTLTGFQAWAAAFGVADGNQDTDGDGVSNYGEYLAGTDPKDMNSTFRLSITTSNAQTVVSFHALRAEGAGYEGLARYYSLHTGTNAALGAWVPAAGCTNVLGTNQTVSYIQPVTNGAATFYRGLVELRGP